MSTATIKPIYKITEREGAFGIFGTETTTGEAIEIKTFTKDRSLAESLAATLNKNQVSLCQARDVILDEVIKGIIE